MWFQGDAYSVVNRGGLRLKYVKAPSFLAPPAQENACDHNNLLRSETSPKWMCRPGCTWWLNQVGSWCQNEQNPWRGTALKDSKGKTEEQAPFPAYKKIAVLPVCAPFFLTDPYGEMLPVSGKATGDRHMAEKVLVAVPHCLLSPLPMQPTCALLQPGVLSGQLTVLASRLPAAQWQQGCSSGTPRGTILGMEDIGFMFLPLHPSSYLFFPWFWGINCCWKKRAGDLASEEKNPRTK